MSSLLRPKGTRAPAAQRAPESLNAPTTRFLHCARSCCPEGARSRNDTVWTLGKLILTTRSHNATYNRVLDAATTARWAWRAKPLQCLHLDFRALSLSHSQQLLRCFCGCRLVRCSRPRCGLHSKTRRNCRAFCRSMKPLAACFAIRLNSVSSPVYGRLFSAFRLGSFARAHPKSGAIWPQFCACCRWRFRRSCWRRRGSTSRARRPRARWPLLPPHIRQRLARSGCRRSCWRSAFSRLSR